MVPLVKYIKYFSLLGVLFVLFGQVDSYAQQLKVFSVESVEDDPFDMSANAKAATKKVDGSGDLYAILKITSDDVDDDLRAYNFDFGMLKSIVEVHDAEGEIWVYVQKNAKQVTITRSGYRTVSRYDLQRTFESGKVYRMKISVKKEVAVVGKGTLMFQITPAKAGIMVTYTNSDGVESLFGATDEYGQVAKYIELGTYTFSVVAESYHKSEGRVKLESKNGTHIEEVVLRPNFADVELVAASGADNYVDVAQLARSVLVAAKSQSSSVAVIGSKSGTIKGHEYVDLGLPSGLKWATCNVGANSPEEYGYNYAWGEIKTKSEYIEDNSKTYRKSMNDISGNSKYDVARAKWGGSWRLPTKKELEELESKCKWEWTTINGKIGYKVTGPNGNSIFLPAAGFRLGSSPFYAGEYGSYWSSSPLESFDFDAYCLFFDYSNHNVYRNPRCYGQSVRPVSE